MPFLSNSRWLGIITLALITVNIAVLSFLWIHHRGRDERMPPMPPPGAGPVFEFVNKELNLTKEQQDAYAKLRDEHQKSTLAISDSLRLAKDAFFDLLKQSNINDARVKQNSDRVMQFQQQLELTTFRHFQQIRALCNENQQKKFDSIIVQVTHLMAPHRQGPPPMDGRDEERRRPPLFPGPGNDRPPPPPEEKNK